MAIPPASEGDQQIVQSQEETTEAINNNTAAFKAVETKLFQGLGGITMGLKGLKKIATLNFDFTKAKEKEANAREGLAIESEREGRRQLTAMFQGIGDKLSGIGKSFKEGVADKFKSARGSIFGAITKVLKTLLIGVGAFAFFKLLQSWANGDFKGFGEAWEKIKTLFSDKIMPMLNKLYNDVLLPLVDFFVGTLLPILTKMFGGIIDSFMTNIDTVIKGFQDIFADDGDRSILGGIMKIITGIGGFLLGAVDSVLTAIFELFGADFGEEGTLFGSIGSFFTGIYDGVVNFFTTTIPNAISSSLDFLGRMTDKVTGFFGEVFAEVQLFFTDMFNSIQEQIGVMNVFQFVTQTLGDAWNAIKAIFGGDFSAENFTQLFGSLFDIVFYGVNLAVNVVKDIFGFDMGEGEPFRLSEFVGDTIEKVIQYLKDIIPTFEDLKAMLPSPSSLLDAINPFSSSDSEEDKPKTLRQELDEIYDQQSRARELGLSNREKQQLKRRELEIKKLMRGNTEGVPSASGGLTGAEIDARSQELAANQTRSTITDLSTRTAVTNNTDASITKTTVATPSPRRTRRRSGLSQMTVAYVD